MKHFSILIAAALMMLTGLDGFAQCFGLTSKDTELKYAFELGGKDVGAYMTVGVDRVMENADRTMTVDCIYHMLDSKGNTHKSAKMMGLGDGLIVPVGYDNCGYYLTEDFIFCQNDNRMGFLMKVPAEMSVGQQIEGGSFKSSVKMPLGGTVHNDITFSELVVKEETDLTLADGQTVHCFVIQGRATGTAYRSKQDSPVTLWFARGIGIVKEEVETYIDTRKTYTATLVGAKGLK